jgi:hypothetical protein
MEFADQLPRLCLNDVLSALSSLDTEKYPERLDLLLKRKEELITSESILKAKYSRIAKVPLDLEAINKQPLANGIKLADFVLKKVMFGYLIRKGGEEFVKTRMSKVMDAKGKACGTVEGMVMNERDRFILRLEVSGRNHYLMQGGRNRGHFPKPGDAYSYLVRLDDALIGEFEIIYGLKPELKSGYHFAGEEEHLWFLGLAIIHETLFNTEDAD